MKSCFIPTLHPSAGKQNKDVWPVSLLLPYPEVIPTFCNNNQYNQVYLISHGNPALGRDFPSHEVQPFAIARKYLIFQTSFLLFLLFSSCPSTRIWRFPIVPILKLLDLFIFYSITCLVHFLNQLGSYFFGCNGQKFEYFCKSIQFWADGWKVGLKSSWSKDTTSGILEWERQNSWRTWLFLHSSCLLKYLWRIIAFGY